MLIKACLKSLYPLTARGGGGYGASANYTIFLRAPIVYSQQLLLHFLVFLLSMLLYSKYIVKNKSKLQAYEEAENNSSV